MGGDTLAMKIFNYVYFILVLNVFLGLNQIAQAYPNYISYGYQSCMSCHYNPFGNGPLTDYGRAVSATSLSDRLTWKSSTTEETIAGNSDFYFGKKNLDEKYKWLRPSASYRGLFLTRALGQDSQSNNFITMDAGVGLVLKFLNDKLIFSGSISYAPPKGIAESVQEYRSREHYVGYRINEKWGVYTGLMDKVFGIRVPDHTAFSRTTTNNNQNDQTHGALVHYTAKKFEAGLQAFIGNLVQDSELRQKGVTGQVEYALNETTRLGTSLQVSSSSLQDINMYAFHLRKGAGKGNSVLFELGQVNKDTVGIGKQQSTYLFLQNHISLRRGLWTILTAEAVKPNSDFSDYILRFGPGLQWFPTQRVEIRTDIYNSKTYGSSSLTDEWYIASQLHLWF